MSEQFEKWFTKFKEDNFLCEPSWALSTRKSIARQYAEAAYLEGQRTPSPSSDNRDWTEDLTHENGDYTCKCSTCDSWFRGHKRRITCKVCAVKTSADKLIEALERISEEECSSPDNCVDCISPDIALEALAVYQKEQL